MDERFVLMQGDRPALSWLFWVNGLIRKVAGTCVEDATALMNEQFPGAEISFKGVMV